MTVLTLDFQIRGTRFSRRRAHANPVERIEQNRLRPRRIAEAVQGIRLAGGRTHIGAHQQRRMITRRIT